MNFWDGEKGRVVVPAFRSVGKIYARPYDGSHENDVLLSLPPSQLTTSSPLTELIRAAIFPAVIVEC